jgi:hypothetical protein
MTPPIRVSEEDQTWITAQVTELKRSRAAICEELASRGTALSIRTLSRLLITWGVSYDRAPPISAAVQEAAEQRIAYAFYALHTTDRESARILQDDGCRIGEYTVRRLRYRLGLKKRITGVVAQQQMDDHVQRIVSAELDKGSIEGYGYRLAFKHLASRFKITGRYIYAYDHVVYMLISLPSPRDRVYAALRNLNQNGLRSRRLGTRAERIRGPRALGPNHAWSIDAHCKLEHFGFQIYAAIDVYSRFVIWTYVGVSARTALCVFAQYIRSIEASGTIPRVIQSDRGGETRRLADLHFQLSQVCRDQQLTFGECFRYGTSKMNQTIEGWWRQQARAIGRWRRYFHELLHRREYDKDLLADRVAMLAIYMPIIAEAVDDFVGTWNTHRIRRQPQRNHHVAGIPHVLYHNPSLSVLPAIDCRVHVPAEAVSGYREALAGYNIDEYLPPTTITLCNQLLAQQGFALPISGSATDSRLDRVHVQAYLRLRAALNTQLENGVIIAETERPLADHHWQPSSAYEEALRAANEVLFE